MLIPGEAPAPDARPVAVVVDGGALANWVIGVTEMLGPQLPALLDAMADGREHDVLASMSSGPPWMKDGFYSFLKSCQSGRSILGASSVA